MSTEITRTVEQVATELSAQPALSATQESLRLFRRDKRAMISLYLLLFFRFRRPAIALADICILWVATAVTAREFARKHRIAAALVLPYLMWVSYAALVNGRAWWHAR